jgi:hypothetical protein
MSISGAVVGPATFTAATVGASAPATTDDVIINATCGAPGTVSGPSFSTSSCANYTAQAPTGGTLYQGYLGNLNVYGNYQIIGSNVEYAPQAGLGLVLSGTTTGLTIDPGTSSNLGPSLYMNGAGGYYTLANNYNSATLSGDLYLIAGTLDTNASANYSMSFASAYISNVSNTRGLMCNYSNITITYDAGYWSAGSSTTTGLTLSASNANLIFTGGNQTANLGNTQSYGNIIVNSTALAKFMVYYSNGITVNNFTVGNRAASGIGTVFFNPQNNGNILYTNTITALSGTDSTMRTALVGSGGTTLYYGEEPPANISANGTVSLTNVDLSDLNILGTSVPWTGNNLGNAGNVSNVTFPASKTVYWVGSSNANWGSNSWSTIEGGTANANSMPLAQDIAIFDATYPSPGNTITYNANYYVGTLNTSARTSNAMTISLGPNTMITLGNISLSNGTTITSSTAYPSLLMNPRANTMYITSGGGQFPANTGIRTGGGNVQLQDSFVISGSNVTTGNVSNLLFVSGNLILNNQTLTTGLMQQFVYIGGTSRSINFGTSGAINVAGFSTTVWNCSDTTITTSGQSNVNLIYAGSTGTRSIQTYLPIGTFNDNSAVSFNVVAGSDTISITGGNVIRDLNFTGFSGTFNSQASLAGNLTFSSTMNTPTLNAQLDLCGGNGAIGTTRTIKTNGKSGNYSLYLTYASNSNITVNLQDDYLMTSSATTGIQIASGTLNFNGHNANMYSISMEAGTTLRGINFSSGNINLFGSGTVMNANVVLANGTFNGGTGNIYLTNTTTAKTFDGNGRTFNNVYQAGAGNLTLLGNSTFNTLGATVANTTVTFTAATTQTVSNFSMKGNVGNIITLNSSTAGSKWKISMLASWPTADYLAISDSNATGGASWYAGAHSTNVANNQGWIFSNPPIGITISGGIYIDTTHGGITFPNV